MKIKMHRKKPTKPGFYFVNFCGVGGESEFVAVTKDNTRNLWINDYPDASVSVPISNYNDNFYWSDPIDLVCEEGDKNG